MNFKKYNLRIEKNLKRERVPTIPKATLKISVEVFKKHLLEYVLYFLRKSLF
jgi:hypothetical protein|tara:strand:- start:294 stop:449 length:156 start_codon:yes stop_codon:yes gene_type:complete